MAIQLKLYAEDRSVSNREPFYRIKPICDSVMVHPTPEHIARLMEMLPTVDQDNLQELQQYILFPLITQVKSAENGRKYDILIQIIDAITVVLQRIKVVTLDVILKTEAGLLTLVFDRAKLGMVAEVPEELKLSVMKCLTVLMLGASDVYKIKLMKTHVPLLAQAVFVSVHIAKLDRMRELRLASIECLSAHTMSHRKYADSEMYLKSSALDEPAADFLASILPGVLAALQDVAKCRNNPGHAVIVASLDAIHRVMCITMSNKRLKKKPRVRARDFAAIIMGTNDPKKDHNGREVLPKDLPLRSAEWYRLAGDRLQVVTKSLVALVTHEHHLVRRELAVLCTRVVQECCDTMLSSVPPALDVLITLSKDDYKEVSEYSSKVVRDFFNEANPELKMAAMEGVCENFFVVLSNLPRILNNIDSSRKLAALNLVHGYIEVLCGQESPQRLTVAVSAADRCDAMCDALSAAAAVQHDLALFTKQNGRDLSTASPSPGQWLRLRHLDTVECRRALEAVLQLLGGAECAALLMDRLLDLFHQRRDCELLYIMNWMGSAPKAPTRLAKRIIDTYIAEDIWYLPLEVGSDEQPLSSAETLDPDVYNPRAWVKDSVPGLYEGATEVRYTDISYRQARVRSAPAGDTCRTVAQAQRNLAQTCLLTEGLGRLARRLGADYQPYLLKTLCLVLERVGSKYDILHNSGTRALNDIAAACELPDARALLAQNADYLTAQISRRLKKPWDVQSALQILSVVMNYSDSSNLDYLYAIVDDVLVQSCDKYHQRSLFAYLQVFECFVHCISQWFPDCKPQQNVGTKNTKDYLKEYLEYKVNVEKVEKLLSNEDFERECGKSAEEMYREDVKKREEEALDYDDTVTKPAPPLPKHVTVTIAVLKRCINFIALPQRDEGVLSMQVVALGLPVLRQYQDELLPLVHKCWAPLVGKLVPREPMVMRKAFQLLVTIANLAGDFLRPRAFKDAFPPILKFLSVAAKDSYLKDRGAAYRLSAAYALQVAALTQLPLIVSALALSGAQLATALPAAAPYLQRKQPRQLQNLAVQFYRLMLEYDYCATWYYLRQLCANDDVVQPPLAGRLKLRPLVGTPYRAVDTAIDPNIKRIFLPQRDNVY